MNINRYIRNYSLLLLSLLFMQLIAPSPAQSRMPVKVGVYQNAPLTFIDENGKVEGFFIDILESIADKENWKIEYVQSSFSECLSNLESGRIDLLGAVAYSKSRGKLFDFTFESVFTNWGQMYINNKTDIESIIDLAGKKVAVLQGDIFFDDLRKLVNQFGIQCRFIEAFEYEDVLKLVEIGRCQAGLVSQVYGTRHERNYDIYKSSILVSPKKIYWAAPKGKTQNILFALDKRIRELKSDEQSIYYEAINKWFGIGVKSKLGRWFKWIIISVLSLLALFFTYSLILRVQVKSKIKELLIKNEELIEEIESRKQVEEALRDSEERFRNVNDTAPLAFVVWDKKTRVTDWNKKAEEIFGWSKEEVVNHNFFDFLVPEKNRPQVEDVVNGLLKGDLLSHSINENLTKEGKIITCEWNNSAFHDSDGNIIGAISLGLDITDRKQAEEALRKSEEKLARSKKMESLGLLAGGVAHDLNNVLSGIVSYPELLLLGLPKDSNLRKPIETIRETGLRAAAIVQDLITVARGVATTKEPLNLNAIVEGYLLSPEFKKLEQFHSTVAVWTNLDTDLFNINGSDAHLRKVVMNLVSNAVEAMEGSGNVTISTMNRYVDRPIKGYDDVSVGEYAILSVSDGGSGISSDDLERVFEPFYTKKVMGRSGTGLGLAVVWNVVQDLKGYIDVISGDNGTTFELYFPVTRDAVSDKALSIHINDYKGDGETVLVVDDVESQREIACKMLETLGYKTKAVSSGEEAVEYLKEHTVDLILLDMIMEPGINGRETYERIIKIHPNQKAVIASGFAETDDVKESQKLGAGQYIKKPLTLEKMGIAIRDELKK